jgi:hypothetical protein
MGGDMKKITHQTTDETMDALCRDIVQAARASETEIEAAANAPFLYPQLLARIAAEQEAQRVVQEQKKRSGIRDFLVMDWAWQGRWIMTAAAVAVLVLGGWAWLRSSPAETTIAQQQNGLAATLPTPMPEAPDKTPDDVRALPAPVAKTSANAKTVTPKVRRALTPKVTDTEIATDYIPLTYIAPSADRSGQVVRVEMPRSAMLAMGLPLNNEPTGELVKADVIVGDDGLALAIRFVR